MLNTDMFVLTIENDQIVVQVKICFLFTQDHWSTGYTRPTVDTEQDYTVLGYELTANSMNVKFKRPLDTGDSD